MFISEKRIANTRVVCLRKSNCRSGEQTFDGCFRRVNGVRHCLSNLSDKYVLTFLRFDQNGAQMVKSTGRRSNSSPRAELYQKQRKVACFTMRAILQAMTWNAWLENGRHPSGDPAFGVLPGVHAAFCLSPLRYEP